ncbi:MAG: methyltransferase domain-containing protein [Bacteroidetes bacterium]|nr:methyltransferase domain-containing protein [Bacteroidota bacterium]
MQVEVQTIENNDRMTESACGCGSGGCGCHSGKASHGEFNPEIPERFQLLQEGDRVVEFGSGSGNDCLIAARVVGPAGKVIGIDISSENISRSWELMDSTEVSNVEFRLGDIEQAPVPDEYADVIYSSCVFNLQSNKQKVADEMYRVCKHNGYVCVSDFVILSEIPEELRAEAAKIAGCVQGVERVENFMAYFQKTGFTRGGIVEVNKLQLPDDLLTKYLSTDMVAKYNDINSDDGIFSVVLVVEKPETCNAETCCHNADKHKN